MRTVWPPGSDGPRRETETGRQQTSLAESRTVRSSSPDGPPTIEMIFLCLFKRICILKPEALLALMQMLPFMLYEALSFTPIKFIDPSNSTTVYPINPVNFFSKHLLTDKNKTYILPLPSLDPQSMVISLKDFTVPCGPILHSYFSKNC